MEEQEDDEVSVYLPKDGSQTERKHGTYGGRHKWISKNRDSQKSTTTRNNAKITAPAIHAFLSSLGIGSKDEIEMMNREADEVSTLRREYDTIRDNRIKKELELKKIEEEIEAVDSVYLNRKMDDEELKNIVTQLENRTMNIEAKLNKEMTDKGVYKHMAQRLLDEVEMAKKVTTQKEANLQSLQDEIEANHITLLTARQEKAAAEQTCKNLQEHIVETRGDNDRAVGDLMLAIKQAKKKCKILKLRQESRNNVVVESMGELTVKRSTRLKQEKFLRQTQFNEIQKNIQDAEEKFQFLEAEYNKIAEAAGTANVDGIISKYLTREETYNALKSEYAEAESRMKRLRDKSHQLKDNLNNIRETGTNARGIYQEMDDTANQLEETEKHSQLMSEKCNRVNVILDSFRSSMIKSLQILSNVQGVMEFWDGGKLELSQISNASITELVHLVEQKLHHVIDTVNREKAELDLHRAEALQGLRGSESAEKILSIRQPTQTETEEHFILRTSAPDTSKTNIRVTVKAKEFESLVKENTFSTEESVASAIVNDEDVVIDRTTRKKLAGMIINREKKTRRSSKHS